MWNVRHSERITKKTSIWPQCNGGNRRVIKRHHLQSAEKLLGGNTVPCSRPSITINKPDDELTGQNNKKKTTTQEANVNTALRGSRSIGVTRREGELVPPQCCPLLSPTWSYLSFFGNSYRLCSPSPRSGGVSAGCGCELFGIFNIRDSVGRWCWCWAVSLVAALQR